MTTPKIPSNEQLSEGVLNGGAGPEDISANAYTLESPDIDKTAIAASGNKGGNAETVDKLQSGEFPLG